MIQFKIKPTLYEFSNFEQFSKEFSLNGQDLIFTNEYIYQPFMGKLDLPCHTRYQEKYGEGEPTDTMVQAIMDEVGKMDCDRVIAVGGGTIIDIAKLLVVGGADDIYDMYDKAEDLTKEKELIIIPTTCGTGSEVTNLSIINLTKLGTKKGLGSEQMYADSAVLIPEFMNTLPYSVFATSSIDALIHATEGFLNPKATPYSDMFGVDAIRMILKGYQSIVENGQDSRLEHGEEFLRASTYAGIAFANSGCATVHAMSYALGGKYHVPHGESNYQFFTDVLAFYKEKAPGGKFAQLESIISSVLGGENAIAALDELLEGVLPKKRMADYGATQEDVATFAKSTMDNQQRLLAGSYLPMTLEDIQGLFQARL